MNASGGLKGDINGDGTVDLADAVLALEVIAGNPVGVRPDYRFMVDVNRDNKVGLPKILYILQGVSGLRKY